MKPEHSKKVARQVVYTWIPSFMHLPNCSYNFHESSSLYKVSAKPFEAHLCKMLLDQGVILSCCTAPPSDCREGPPNPRRPWRNSNTEGRSSTESSLMKQRKYNLMMLRSISVTNQSKSWTGYGRRSVLLPLMCSYSGTIVFTFFLFFKFLIVLLLENFLALGFTALKTVLRLSPAPHRPGNQ